MRHKILFMAIAFLSGCATTPTQPVPSVKDTEVFSAQYDKVWAAAVASVTERGISVDVIERDSGLITTKEVHLQPEGVMRPIPTVLGEYAHKPFSLMGVWQDAWYTMSILVSRESEARTIVKITAKFIGVDAADMKREIPSKGKIEAEVFEAIRKKL